MVYAKKFCFGFIFAVGISFAFAAFSDPIVLTVTGKANETKYGYTFGESYSFYWTLNSDYETAGFSYFSSDTSYWTSDVLADPLLWSSAGGDGLEGVWSSTAQNDWETSTYLYAMEGSAADGDLLIFSVGNSSSYPAGVTAGGTEIFRIWADSLLVPENTLSFSGVDTDVNAYISDLVGNYTLPVGGGNIILQSSSGALVFQAETLTIGAVPEPATALSLLIGGGLLTLIRRFYGRA